MQDNPKIVSLRDIVILKLYYCIAITPREWQDSQFKSLSGLNWKQIPHVPHSLLNIGSYLMLSSERIRKIKKIALLKLSNTPEFVELKSQIVKAEKGKINFCPNLYQQNSIRKKQPKVYKPLLKIAIEIDQKFDQGRISDEILIASILVTVYSRLNQAGQFPIPKMAPIDEVLTALKSNGKNLNQKATFFNSIQMIDKFKNQYINTQSLHPSKYDPFILAYKFMNKNPTILYELVY